MKTILLYSKSLKILDTLKPELDRLKRNGWNIQPFINSNLLVPEMQTSNSHIGGLSNIRNKLEEME